MWKPEHRRAAARGGLRYPSDLTDAEWALIETSSFRHARLKVVGKQRTVDANSEVLNAMLYLRALYWLPMEESTQPKDDRAPRARSALKILHAVGEWGDGTLEADIPHQNTQLPSRGPRETRMAKRSLTECEKGSKSTVNRVPRRHHQRGSGARSAGLRL